MRICPRCGHRNIKNKNGGDVAVCRSCGKEVQWDIEFDVIEGGVKREL